MKKIYIFFLPLLISTSLTAEYFVDAIPEKICTTLLGNEDVSLPIKKLLKKALADYGIFSDVPLKKVSNRVPVWIKKFYSFTWFGIWINEQQFNQLPLQEKIFAAYHEAAHYAYHHPKFFINNNALMTATSIGLSYLLADLLIKSKSLSLLTASALTSLLLIHTIPNMNRQYEKMADELAARKLIETNQEYVVCYMLEEMYKQLHEYKTNDFWFPSLQQRIETLEKTLMPTS